MMNFAENLTERPNLEQEGEAAHEGAQIDLLSRVLAQIQLTGERVYSLTVPKNGNLQLPAEVGCICIVGSGAIRIEAKDAAPVSVGPGDLLMLPRGATGGYIATSREPTSVIVCRFSFDPSSLSNMINALPPCIFISKEEGAAWLEGFVHFLVTEIEESDPGSFLMISRLIELGVIRSLRTWIRQGRGSGWLGGSADARIARVLNALHNQPTHSWSIEAMADIAGMSRSNFCKRFTSLVGRSPLNYRNDCRLSLARDLLLKPDARVGEVAEQVGYESDAAFSRAFKSYFGYSPGRMSTSVAEHVS
jgi:AraC-like DNA-binding protein